MVVGGKLVFKGGVAAGKKGISKKKKQSERSETDRATEKKEIRSRGDDTKSDDDEELRPVLGTGRISSSATAVTGHGTKFMSEIRVGDAIIVSHPSSLALETRLVKMVLSDTSIGISSAFSSDLVSTTVFQYVNAPVNKNVETPEEMLRKSKLEEENKAYGTYSSNGGTKVVYRVKKAGQYGGYEIVQSDSKKPMTREELLNIRSKKKADRYCY